ncbi:MAG: hypothetical protein OSB02_12825, partial [Rhodospirillaceae bacterium]|nr:hypothetical protein [Rhodospirillaceae bacterium]
MTSPYYIEIHNLNVFRDCSNSIRNNPVDPFCLFYCLSEAVVGLQSVEVLRKLHGIVRDRQNFLDQ